MLSPNATPGMSFLSVFLCLQLISWFIAVEGDSWSYGSLTFLLISFVSPIFQPRPLLSHQNNRKLEEQENVEPLETDPHAVAKPTETKSLLLSRLSWHLRRIINSEADGVFFPQINVIWLQRSRILNTFLTVWTEGLFCRFGTTPLWFCPEFCTRSRFTNTRTATMRVGVQIWFV